ncbi:hypothetical protein SRRS_34420 [Sporomusa rhizae]|uniref:hypothetical protein n=1 Tax=Sporomusa rhizae TaxID=357999 RepID=UPI00352B81E5
MAEGIAIGMPRRSEEILEYIYKYDIKVITAPEERILEARMALATKGIIVSHYSGQVRGLLKYCEMNGKTSDCLILMCGSGFKSDH